MGTKYTTTTVVGYNSTPPADDGTVAASNKILWDTIKTKLPDPLNTAIASINTKLVDAFNVGPVTKTATYTTVAGDHDKTLECSGTFTVSLMDAASAGAGYTVEVNNQGTGTITVSRITAGDTINTVAGNVTLAAKVSKTFRVITTANGYAIIAAGGDLGTAALVNTGTSGATIPLLNAANTFATGQKFGAGSGAVDMIIDGGVAIRGLRYRTAGADKFVLFVNSTAQSGASAGSDFAIARYDDAGGYLGQPVTVYRADGGVTLAAATGASKGDGTLNAVNLYVQGSAVLKQSDIFVSADQTITAAGSLTIAHGLATAPRLVQTAFVCQTAEHGYSIGDVVVGGVQDKPSIVSDATNISVRFYNGSPVIVHKTTGATSVLTVGNWKARFLALK